MASVLNTLKVKLQKTSGKISFNSIKGFIFGILLCFVWHFTGVFPIKELEAHVINWLCNCFSFF